MLSATPADYRMWVLIPNTVISFIMLITPMHYVERSRLHPDLLNSARLLDISKNGDFCLFNESLGSTV
jgi:hypothetical protein